MRVQDTTGSSYSYDDGARLGLLVVELVFYNKSFVMVKVKPIRNLKDFQLNKRCVDASERLCCTYYLISKILKIIKIRSFYYQALCPLSALSGTIFLSFFLAWVSGLETWKRNSILTVTQGLGRRFVPCPNILRS